MGGCRREVALYYLLNFNVWLTYEIVSFEQPGPSQLQLAINYLKHIWLFHSNDIISQYLS